MVSRQRAPLLAGIVALVVGAAAARAQPAMTEAEREFRLGYQALQVGDCNQALVHYRRSLAIVARPRTIFNIATCQEQLGQIAEAVASYRAFLDRAEARDAAIVVTARARLDALRGRVAIETEPSGAAVLVDGEHAPRGLTPLTLMLDPGAHVVKLTAPDGATLERTIEVSPDGLTSLRVDLPQPATLAIRVEPSDAVIELDGGQAPARGHLEVRLRPGRHRVIVRRSGYRDERIVIDAVAGRTYEHRVRLRAATGLATLVLTGIPGGTVTVDGVDAGVAPDASGRLSLGAVGAGLRELHVARAGFAPWRASLKLAPGEVVTVDLRLPVAQRPVLRWGLGGLGVAGLTAGGVMGVLALRDVASASPGDHDRGKARALVADGLVVAGTAALVVAWRLARQSAPVATIRRRLGGAR